MTKKLKRTVSLSDSKDLVNMILSDLKERRYQGLDPSAIRFSKKVLNAVKFSERVLPYNLGRKVVYKLLFFSGDKLIRLIAPEEKVYAKSLGLILSSYVNLKEKEIIKEEEFYYEIEKIVKLLLEKKIVGKKLWAHEVNYTIQGEDVTTSTPNLITTAFVAFGIYDLAVYTKDERYAKLYSEIISDMLEEFPLIKTSKETGCFMYTPITNFYVHNSNLIMAELLVRQQNISFSNENDEKILYSLRYSLNEFEQTNSFYYAGSPTTNKSIDNYHTGYVLRSLNTIKLYLKEYHLTSIEYSKIQNRINYGVSFYLQNFIGNFVIRDHLKTLETHSLAESILFLKEFNSYLSKDVYEELFNAINNTMEILWDTEREYFIYVARLRGKKYKKDKTYMIRWSQSWMAYSLSYYC